MLAPLLFILFMNVNDLPEWIKNSMRMFADDVKIWNVMKSDTDSGSVLGQLPKPDLSWEW